MFKLVEPAVGGYLNPPPAERSHLERMIDLENDVNKMCAELSCPTMMGTRQNDIANNQRKRENEAIFFWREEWTNLKFWLKPR